MTQIKVWTCDICKRKFEEGINYQSPEALLIVIPSASMFEREEKFTFTDTCRECREGIRFAISDFVDKQEEKYK